MACPYYPPDTGYLQSILGFMDCQARTIGEQGYLALSVPGSIGSLFLTSVLTLFVALIGYRMLFGEVPGVRGGVLALVKIGLVLALASNWQAYRTLLYDVTLYAPAELASAVGAPAGVPGANGGLVGRLDGLDRGFEALAIEGVGPPPDPSVQRVPPPMFGGFDVFALGASRVVFLVGAMGAFAGLRLLAGLMLALGPLFIGFLLFDSTRGLFAGWIRVLLGTVLGVLATAITLGVELALLEPWLTDLLARRAAEQPIPGAPAQLFAATLVFGITLIAMLAGTARLAWALRLPETLLVPLREHSLIRETRGAAAFEHQGSRTAIDTRSRAAAIVDAVAANQRRETAAIVRGGGTMAGAPPGHAVHQPLAGIVQSPAGTRDGSARRRTTARISTSARRRDRSA
jgi:type IV secretion system protein VirB6